MQSVGYCRVVGSQEVGPHFFLFFSFFFFSFCLAAVSFLPAYLCPLSCVDKTVGHLE